MSVNDRLYGQTFTNVTDLTHMGLTICSMTGTVGDYDRDGDLDVFVSNNPPIGQVLMENQGTVFEDVSLQVGLGVVINGWGALWIDHDNDGWEDLLMGNTYALQPYPGNLFFRNMEAQYFQLDNAVLGQAGDQAWTYACAMGDMNNDGHYDFVANNRHPQAATLNRNQGSTNHWYGLSLQGTASNSDGVGTWVHCYAGGEQWSHYTLCGSDLVGQRANRIIFGLGGHTTVDSLVIEWNRGLREVYAVLIPST